jgi:hypothetical protein
MSIIIRKDCLLEGEARKKSNIFHPSYQQEAHFLQSLPNWPTASPHLTWIGDLLSQPTNPGIAS